MSEQTAARYPNWMVAGIAFFACAQMGFGVQYYRNGDVGLATGSLAVIALLGYALASAYRERVK